MAINLYIALEAALVTLRRRLSRAAGRDVSYDTVFDFVRETFAYGDALTEYWRDVYDDRTMVLHPDNRVGNHAIPPLSADDVLELFDPMLSLYRFVLIGKARPA
jgi:hypothetical protein